MKIDHRTHCPEDVSCDQPLRRGTQHVSKLATLYLDSP
jgi:hypothetical protein